MWHLGDVLWTARAFDLLDRLNGTKNLVLGNHDADYSARRWLEHFNNIHGYKKFDGNLLSHIPIHHSQKYRFKHNIHGHLHSSKIMKSGDFNSDFKDVPDPFYVNVSCEQINLTPIAYEELKKRFESE